MEMTKQREFSTLSPKQNMNIWKINLNSLPASAPKHTIVLSHSWFFIFSSILIYLLTLQTVSTILLACSHWFTAKSILIPPACWKWKFSLNPGMWIWDYINGNRGKEEEQSVPECCIACTWPPGGNDRHAAEYYGAWCPGHRQGNTTINTTAATINVKALG